MLCLYTVKAFFFYICAIQIKGVMDKNEAVKLCNPLFYLPLQAFENMNKKSAFIVVVK